MSDDKQATEKMFYSISEVSDMLGMPASTLRYWEKEIPTVAPRKSHGGTRKYSASDIEELRLVQRLVKVEGHTIEGVKKLLRSRRSPEVTKHAVVQRLTAVKSELEAMIAELDRLKTIKL